jgi:hypothetical protein
MPFDEFDRPAKSKAAPNAFDEFDRAVPIRIEIAELPKAGGPPIPILCRSGGRPYRVGAMKALGR